MNQSKLKVVKQEMARVNIDILGISKLKWTGMDEFNSDDQYIYYYRQESLRRNGVGIMVNKRARNAVLGCNLKNDRMISVSKASHSISQNRVLPRECAGHCKHPLSTTQVKTIHMDITRWSIVKSD